METNLQSLNLPANNISDNTRKAGLSTGIISQDGAHFTELLGKGYEVNGIKRRTSLFIIGRASGLPRRRLRHPLADISKAAMHLVINPLTI